MKDDVCLRDIHAKWEKISDQEVSGMKTKSDPVSQVQTKYSLNKDQAQKDVDSWANVCFGSVAVFAHLER